MRLPILSLLICLGGCAATPPAPLAPYAYRTFLPPDYEARPGATWPLIVYLHGANPTLPPESAIADFVHATPEFPFIVVAPRADGDWSASRLDAVVEEIGQRYRVDTQRRYLTGLSMGARGAAALGARIPEHFAAVVLVAGAGDPATACRLKRVPVWLIHNRQDSVAPLEVSQNYRSALVNCNGQVRITVNETLPAGRWDHDAWTGAYADPELYRWLLRQKGGR